jgi:hypothetical protein
VGGRLRVVSGDGQRLRAFEKSAPFVIQALDGNSNPLRGVKVTFFFGLSEPKSTRSSSSYQLTTGSDGMASCPGVAPIVAGVQYVRIIAIDDRMDLFKSDAVFMITVTER